MAADEPFCPLCGARMRLVGPGEDWRAFWGCTEYRRSGCRGKREVDPTTGDPAMDDEPRRSPREEMDAVLEEDTW